MRRCKLGDEVYVRETGRPGVVTRVTGKVITVRHVDEDADCDYAEREIETFEERSKRLEHEAEK